MEYIILLSIFLAVWLGCLWTLGQLGPSKHVVALCVSLICVTALAREPATLRLLEIPYPALALAMLLAAMLWICVRISRRFGR